MKGASVVVLVLGFLVPIAGADCYSDNFAALNWDGWKMALGGAPLWVFDYPEYDTTLGGDPQTADIDGNGIYDSYEFAFLAKAMCLDPAIDARFQANLAFHNAIWGGYANVEMGAAAMDTISTSGSTFVSWGISGSANGPYDSGSGEPMAAGSDFDGDGVSNLQEFQEIREISSDPALFVRAVTDPSWLGAAGLPLMGWPGFIVLLGLTAWVGGRKLSYAK
ncbi:MAG: hypothetical protein WC655_13905 [Candidatus Hydrogenedentales bacterium]|jgi:hypothetical protein